MTSQINSENFTENLKAAALDAPSEPGVYIMRNEGGEIIYVGKAKSLKNRLGSYFAGNKDIKTATLMRHVASIETILVANEYEALLLENTLIKQHSPRYNINLKDGKTYPVIRLTAEEFPRIFRTRRIVDDNSLYFGPFPNVQLIDSLLDIIKKFFPLRKCRKMKKHGPCMYYHIGLCMAPCVGKIQSAEYAGFVEQVKQLLAGETEALIVELTRLMHNAARELKFERAAQLRNAIKAIEALTGEGSAVVDFDPDARDYIAWASEGVLATFTVFSMRGGKMTGRDLYRTRCAAAEEESIEMFITTYYDSARLPPPHIYLQNISQGSTADTEKIGNGFGLLYNWFKTKFDYAPELLLPLEKHHAAIHAMARQNAAEDLAKRLKERGAGPALDELARVLNLKSRPERIEGFDIAQLDGKYPVASLISFKNGIPDKKNYRYFKLRTVIGIVDDFAAMREAVQRRYSRLIREGAELPDLVLIDGGIGQVNAAQGVMQELGMDSDVAGLAKRNEELWLPAANEPVVLPRQSEALKVLQYVRDETHRFATGLNQKLRSKGLFLPILESVEGIGPKRAAAIIKAYQSLDAIAAAEPQEIAERCRISAAAAQAVRAAARLALEDRQSAQQHLAEKSRRTTYPSGGSGASTHFHNAASTHLHNAASTHFHNAASLAAEAAAPYGDRGAAPYENRGAEDE